MNHKIENKKYDIVLQEKDTKTTCIIDIAIPATQKYFPLAAEIKAIWKQDYRTNHHWCNWRNSFFAYEDT